jgi:hypothetical protein
MIPAIPAFLLMSIQHARQMIRGASSEEAELSC